VKEELSWSRRDIGDARSYLLRTNGLLLLILLLLLLLLLLLFANLHA
jgi:hypothetical protein